MRVAYGSGKGRRAGVTRFETIWAEVRSSLWLLPSLMMLGAILLALGTIRLDRAATAWEFDEAWWMFGGGAEEVRSVLSAIAGGIMTVTGVVFSITIVALQQASSQFTPRVLRRFTSDRVNHVVLGVLIGTFAYAILVQRSVRSVGAGQQEFVPRISVTLALVLVLASLVALIFFISHVSRIIQASEIIDRITRETRDQIMRLFPERVGEPVPESEIDTIRDREHGRAILSTESGYLQALDEDTLIDLAGRERFALEMAVGIGEFVLRGAPLAWGWPADAIDEARETAVRKAFVFGRERTAYQDVEFGLIELMDIAVRALSTSYNDATTAMICIDRLSELLAELGNREPPTRFRTDPDGRLLFIARRTTFARAVEVAFDQIRLHGTSNPGVARRMLEALERVATRVPPQLHGPLALEARQVLRATELAVGDRVDLEFVRRAAPTLLARKGR